MTKEKTLQLIGAGDGLKTDNGSMRPGEIHLANEDRLSEAYFSEPLTTYATGWRDNSGLKESLDFVAPEVPVNRRFDFKKARNADEFLSESDDVRAVGSDFKRVEFRGEETTAKTINKGLAYRLDRDEIHLPGKREQIVRRLIDRLYRNDLRRAITALLAITGAGTAKNWTANGGCDPDVLAAINTAGDGAGLDPNRVIYGAGAWQTRYAVYSNSDKAGAFAGLNEDVAGVARKLGLDDGRIVRGRYQLENAAAKARIFGSTVIVFHGQSDVMQDDPTTLKRFVTPLSTATEATANGQPQAGGLVRVYEIEVGAKFIDIIVEHYSNLITTSSVGAARLNIS